MKFRFHTAIACGCCLAMLFSCSRDDVVVDDHMIEIKTIYLSALPPAYVGGDEPIDSADDDVTRSGVAVTSSTFQAYFEHNDTLGIFPEGGYQIPFIPPIEEGNKESQVAIKAQGWMTKDSIYYAAYMPFNFYNRYSNKIPWSFFRKTPKQMENGIANNVDVGQDHLGAFMFMLSDTTLAEGNGGLKANLSHLGCIVRVQCRMPLGGTFVKAVLASSKSDAFITHGTMDLFAEGQPFTPKGYTNYISILFNNFEVATSGIITFYFIAPPSNLASSDLTLYVWDSYGNCYSGPKTYTSTQGSWPRNGYVKLTYTNLTAEYNVPAVYLTPYEYEIEYDTGVALEDY